MEEETHPEGITIDDDDEDHVKPLKVHKDKLKTKASSKDVIVYIPDEEVSDPLHRALSRTRLLLYTVPRRRSAKTKLNAQRFGESKQCGCDRQWKD